MLLHPNRDIDVLLPKTHSVRETGVQTQSVPKDANSPISPPRGVSTHSLMLLLLLVITYGRVCPGEYSLNQAVRKGFTRQEVLGGSCKSRGSCTSSGGSYRSGGLALVWGDSCRSGSGCTSLTGSCRSGGCTNLGGSYRSRGLHQFGWLLQIWGSMGLHQFIVSVLTPKENSKLWVPETVSFTLFWNGEPYRPPTHSFSHFTYTGCSQRKVFIAACI